MDEAKKQEWREKFRAAAQGKVSEPVLGAAPFARTGGYASMALTRVSPLAGLVASLIGKKKAGGFPQNFVLVLTEKKVYAFKYRPGYGVKLGKELAVWDRSGLRVSTEKSGITTRVTLESPAEGEKVVASAGLGGYNDEFIQQLEGSASPAAP